MLAPASEPMPACFEPKALVTTLSSEKVKLDCSALPISLPTAPTSVPPATCPARLLLPSMRPRFEPKTAPMSPAVIVPPFHRKAPMLPSSRIVTVSDRPPGWKRVTSRLQSKLSARS